MTQWFIILGAVITVAIASVIATIVMNSRKKKRIQQSRLARANDRVGQKKIAPVIQKKGVNHGKTQNDTCKAH